VLTLALDTTTRAGSVAVVRDAAVLALVSGDMTRTHGERLPRELDLALHQASVRARELQLLAVASGPGAFTGLRIGLAAMQGLAMVLGIPVVAVSALDALAHAVLTSLTRTGFSSGDSPSGWGQSLEPGTVPRDRGQSPVIGDSPSNQGQSPVTGDSPSGRGQSPLIVACMDAQRGEVFAAWYATSPIGSMVPSEPTVGSPQALLASMPRRAAIFVGDGAIRYEAQILHGGAAGHHVWQPTPELAPFIAQLGQRRITAGETGQPHALQPLYVRRPDAEVARHQRNANASTASLESSQPPPSGDVP
jgi:tRNA threonylcarbamoyl adenosine modification protein YeaZ